MATLIATQWVVFLGAFVITKYGAKLVAPVADFLGFDTDSIGDNSDEVTNA